MRRDFYAMKHLRCELNEKEEWMEGRGRTVARRGGLFFRALRAFRCSEDDVGDGGETAREIAGRERVDGVVV